MRPIFSLPSSVLALAALGSCVAAPAPPPPPRPVPVPAPAPAPRPVAAPTPTPPRLADWRDWPVTPGTWAYRQDARGSIALYGRPGTDADLTLRCDRQRQQIYVSRRADPATPAPLQLTIRTSSTLRAFSAQPSGGEGYFAVQLAVRDSLLDAMGFSRGKFVVESAGMAPLVLPAWSEILRVLEDCRGQG
jgi:hypothetical protein